MAFNSSRLFIMLLRIGLHGIVMSGSERSWRAAHDGPMKRAALHERFGQAD